MKNRLLILLLVPLSCIFLWAGCGPDDRSRQTGYYFGIEYKFKSCIIKAEQDVDEQKFIFNFKDLNNSEQSFYFQFGYNFEYYDNSTEFEYTDDSGNEIVFEEDGYYYFSGDKIIYVSYKNANEETKAAISSGNFSVFFGYGLFILPKHDL